MQMMGFILQTHHDDGKKQKASKTSWISVYKVFFFH